jgi:hypothetical protein
MTTYFATFTPPALDPSEANANSAYYCVDNIGVEGRRRRAGLGWVGFGFGLVLAVGLVLAGMDWWWRLLVFFPFAGAGVNWRQAVEKTCVAFALQGARDLEAGDGYEKVADKGLLNIQRRRALGVILRGSLIGAALTVPVLLFPA